MKMVGLSVCAALTLCLVGCGSAAQSSGSAPAGAPAVTTPPAAKAGTGGEEGGPVGAARGTITVKDGVTVHPAAPGVSAYRLPGLSAPAARAPGAVSAGPLIARTPGPATAKGRLAAGYPAPLAQVAGSVIDVSTVGGHGDRAQVGLQAHSSRSAAQVLADYGARLVPMGFTQATVPGVAGASAARFTRGTDVVTVTASTTAKRTNYTLFALLRTAG